MVSPSKFPPRTRRHVVKFSGAKGGTEVRSIIADIEPTHPGTILKSLLLPKLQLTVKYISYRSGMSEDEVEKLLEAKLPVDKTRRNKLKPIFGKTAEVLFRQQKIFDYYDEHGTRPRTRGPIEKRRVGATYTR